MRHIIFNIESGDPLRVMTRGSWDDAKYDSERTAKAQITRMHKAGKIDRTKFAVLPVSEWDVKYNVMVERVNMMSREPYMEKKYTPSYCSPASESYWSM